ncbi:adenosine deaminase-like protein, partial [Papilio machaon]|uniref:adenosine deaminase-like protein n=1 Tax=Papilio machaon TaxID=76193 RepID=UPI001E662B2A
MNTLNDLNQFCHALPKIELHAHLNGSLSRSTMLQLQRHFADAGISDKSNAFFDEFQIGAGDTRNLSDCFQVFNIAHTLTSTPETLALATSLTLQEFQDDGCCYIELRSTPRDTNQMTKRQYVETIVQTMRNSSENLNIISAFIISINRSNGISEAEDIANLAIEYHKKFPDVVVGLELSGNPALGKFEDFISIFTKARNAGLKVSLHCGEISNPEEIIQMLQFKPDRIGHGTCIHPNYGGTDETWKALCTLKIPVEVCLTSNVNTKSAADYSSHHFKYLHSSDVPVILCTDDKGVFATSLTQEYSICVDTFKLDKSELAKLALNSTKYIFAVDKHKLLYDKIKIFVE